MISENEFSETVNWEWQCSQFSSHGPAFEHSVLLLSLKNGRINLYTHRYINQLIYSILEITFRKILLPFPATDF